ncbi:MAG: hypothetical protein MRERC_1c151 [Mycoplasmataceae bacterium RC_NB112A]|nr:MAG: hypothetical protein MRERC_1c151 [Mycoplasmataceae bacterium RC_NB112A]
MMRAGKGKEEGSWLGSKKNLLLFKNRKTLFSLIIKFLQLKNYYDFSLN